MMDIRVLLFLFICSVLAQEEHCSTQTLHDGAEELSQRHAEVLLGIQRFDQDLIRLSTQVDQQQSRRQQLIERSKGLNSLIQQINALYLVDLVSELNQTVNDGIDLLGKASSASAEEEARTDEEEEVSPVGVAPVTIDDVTTVLDPESLLKNSEDYLQNWILKFVQSEHLSLRKQARDSSEAQTSPLVNSDEDLRNTCLTPMEAAHQIQESVLQHQTPPHDYAVKAAIVSSLTSDSYLAPPQAHDRMGHWHTYIPEDWEELLPEGWEDWNIAGAPASLRSLFGMTSSTLSPQAILNDNVLPGSCWPMVGENGYVTLRLTHAVDVTSVTVEHAPSPLLPTAHGSTPKQFRVVGYPSCESCRGMGFDVTQPQVLGSFEYDIEGSRSIQTFELDGRDCQAESGSCSAPAGPVRGVRFEILSNWGSQDYTCLYRVRVHGSVEQS